MIYNTNLLNEILKLLFLMAHLPVFITCKSQCLALSLDCKLLLTLQGTCCSYPWQNGYRDFHSWCRTTWLPSQWTSCGLAGCPTGSLRSIAPERTRLLRAPGNLNVLCKRGYVRSSWRRNKAKFDKRNLRIRLVSPTPSPYIWPR